jgi:hypothetical protein
MGFFFIISCQEGKERVNDYNDFLLNFLCKISQLRNQNRIIIMNQSIQCKGWFIASLNFRLTWIRLHSKHHSTTNDPWISLICWISDNNKQNVYYNLWYMPCEWRGNIANDVRTSLLVVTKGNGFLKLKSFLKHDCFVCKLAQFTFLIRK